MIISGEYLLLKDKDPSQGLALPIDTFFRSLAQEAQECGIGVVLSGTGSDGSRGIRAIHEAGGLTVVQDPETAKFDGMPRSAVNTGVVNDVLPPGKMAERILNHVRKIKNDNGHSCIIPQDAMEELFKILRSEYSIDFSLYKANTVTRRIDRRLQLLNSNGLAEYVDRLRSDPAEVNHLYKDLLIGVTQFFRDRDAFEKLDQIVLPEILSRVSPDEEIRIWVAGCATGEEAYSLAILLHEHITNRKRPINAKIFATDVHRDSLEIASAGVYSEDSVAKVQQERLNRYFQHKSDGFHVCRELRKMVVFAPHDIVKDAPFTKLDLITCRNLLIYLNPAPQKKAISLFHFSLRSGGFLFLGPSETPGELSDEFETIDRHWKIYRKLRDVRLPQIRLSTPEHFSSSGSVSPPVSSIPQRVNGLPDLQVIRAYDALLEDFVPPSLLVNERRELLHSFSGAGKYLVIRDGRSSKDILDMVSKDLRLFLTGALQRAQKQKIPVVYTGVPSGQGDELLRLTVKPLFGRDSVGMNFLVVFEDNSPGKSPPPTADQYQYKAASQEHILDLEQELRYTKENLQATIEELETSNEELQATNEELVASNEELQSTNEELQSVNEELHTVNVEHQRKIAELTQLTDDMDNLLQGTEIGTIFLDQDLCIRKFTKQITNAFQILPQDVGRRIDTFAHNIDYPDLLKDVTRALQEGVRTEKEVRNRIGKWHFLRVLPYRSHDRVEGVVLTLTDLTNLKKIEQDLQRMSKVFIDGADPVIFEDLNGAILDANREAEVRYGWSREELIGKSILDLIPEKEHEEAKLLRNRCLREKYVRDVESYRQTKRGVQIPVLLTLSLLDDEEGRPSTILTSAKDIGQQKRAKQEAQEAAARRDQFLAMLSHELRNPLGAVLNATYILEQETTDTQAVGKACQVIQRQAKQMSRLLDDLLDIARITQGKIEIRPDVVSLQSVIEGALLVIQPLLKANNHELTVEMPEEPLYVAGDPTRLLQIQENLLTNAIKYTPSGGRIAITVSSDGDSVEWRVSDTGVGIPSHMLDKIFELFIQTQEGLARSEGGMGVGLTLVRDLVHLHGGTIKAHSEGQDKGSTMIVRLPLAKEVPLEQPQTTNIDSSKEKPSILIVEDNPDSREMLASLLRLEGYSVWEAVDGLQGWDLLHQVQPDLAFVDVGLPGLNGYQLAQKVKSERISTYLIALTGYGRDEDKQAVFQAGFHEHLVKPLTIERLRESLMRFSAYVSEMKR